MFQLTYCHVPSAGGSTDAVDDPFWQRLSLEVVMTGAAEAFSCGNGGYSYAGVGAPAHAYGIGASITPLPAFNVLSGHVAGWVGVGGPGQGPGLHRAIQVMLVVTTPAGP